MVILFASRKIFAGLLWHILSLKKAFRTCLSWIKAGTDLKLLRDDQKIDCRGPKRKFSEEGVPYLLHLQGKSGNSIENAEFRFSISFLGSNRYPHDQKTSDSYKLSPFKGKTKYLWPWIGIIDLQIRPKNLSTIYKKFRKVVVDFSTPLSPPST